MTTERVIVSAGNHIGYAARARETAERILALPPIPGAGPMPDAVYAAAARLLRSDAWQVRPGISADRSGAQAALHGLLDEWWPRIRRGEATGEAMLASAALWPDFNSEPPMGEYATVVATCVRQEAGDALDTMITLELGAGTGATTRLLRGSTRDYLATDLHRFRGVKAWDFDAWEWPPGRCPYPPNLILATNAVHCSRDPRLLIRRCRDVLAPDGLLVLGEGYQSDAQPWYQDAAMATLRGWYDRGGFRSDAYWMEALGDAGFADGGRYRLYCGEWDLGGAYWARR